MFKSVNVISDTETLKPSVSEFKSTNRPNLSNTSEEDLKK